MKPPLPPRIENHPPLAHADDGTRLPVPAGATHWRILRGLDPQPARFGLDMTRGDLLELCGPGTYHIEASDQFGHLLGHVTTLSVGEPASRPSGELVLAAAWHQRAARSDDKILATAHVLRVRARLSPIEQRVFDALLREDGANKLIRGVLSRDEDDALVAVRERIAERDRGV